MKKILPALICVLAAARFAAADDVADIAIKIGKEKRLRHVVIEFYDSDAPQTVENFKKLARKKFYSGLAFHRALPHMLVQVGDPFSKHSDRGKVGTGGPGYTLPAEIKRKHIAGAVAMARLPDKINPSRRSNGSQFYVTLQPMPNLDGQYTVFAHVVSGMEVLDEISAKPADISDYPQERIVIKSIKVGPRGKAG
jgi:cyclophilin family peptidyl-prolyl cis-trans isomerase